MLGPIRVAARCCAQQNALQGRRPCRASALSTRLLSSASRVPPRLVIRSQEEMESLGARVAEGRRSSDVIFLRGDLGCGKTCFARGFIRAITGYPRLHVTSPTYLLVNTYDDLPATDMQSPTVHHMDLYRLDAVSDVDAAALGLTDAFATGISLVEWPQRLLASGVPADRLEVHISHDEQDATVRHVQFEPLGERWDTFNLK